MGMSKDALKRAIEAAGSQKRLACVIGTSQSQVWYWLERAKKGVPGEFAIAIERVTGVSRHDLRPDLFGPEIPAAVLPAAASGAGCHAPAPEAPTAEEMAT